MDMFTETMTSAALDGTRISLSVTGLLVSMDTTLDPAQKLGVLDALEEAGQWLEHARMLMPHVPTTSVHVVGQQPGGIIVPR